MEAESQPIPEVVPASEDERAPSAIVPVSPLREETSFWKRVRMRVGSRVGRATGDDVVIARLDAIASRIESSEQAIGGRIRELDERLSEVWEVEEQLSRLMELREMLGEQQERQGRIDARLRSLERRLSLLIFFAAAAAVAGLAAAALALR